MIPLTVIIVVMIIVIIFLTNFQSLIVFYTNADQFLNKRDELQMFIAGNEPDIILITEILPNNHCNTISSSRLSLDDYNAFFNFDPRMAINQLLALVV